MTPYKHFSKNPSWPHRLRRGGIYVTIALLLGTQTNCTNDAGNGNDWESVTTYEVTKGVVTTLEETEPGQFAIVDEQVTGHRDSSRVIVKRLDGSTETLSLAQAKGLVEARDTVYQNTNTYHRHYGMGHTLWWGAMGYMMGRNVNTPVQSYVYRDGSPAGFRSGNLAAQELRRTATPRVELRPIKGRSGFFRNSSRGSRIG